MPQTIQFRRSATPGAVPNPAALADGEIALNIADGKIFYLDAALALKTVLLGGPDPGSAILRGDIDQYAAWTSGMRAQARRNLRRIPSYQSASWTVDAAADIGRLVLYESIANATCTLPALSAAGDGFWFELTTLNLSNRGG